MPRPKKPHPSDRKRRFLQGIERGLTVVDAAEYAGWTDRTSPYKAAQTDPEFAAEWEHARQLRLSILRDTTWDRVMSGDTNGPTVSLIKFLWERFEREERNREAQRGQAQIGRIEIIMPGEADGSPAKPFFEVVAPSESGDHPG